MPTLTIPPQPVEAPADFPWPLHRMSLEQYDALVESGIFTERDRLQLINGILVAKVTQGDDHCVADEDCRTALERALPPGWFIRSNKPVDIPPDGAPSLTRPWCAARTAITPARSGGDLARKMSP